MKHTIMSLFLLVCIWASIASSTEKITPTGVDEVNEIEIPEVIVSGRIEDQELMLNLSFKAETKARNRRILLIQGDAVLQTLPESNTEYKLDYDEQQKAYYLVFSRAGRYQVNTTFVTGPQPDPNSPWQQVDVQVPLGRMRKIELVCDRKDLEVDLPGAMRLQRQTEQGQLTISAILGPNQRLLVRWKPQVKLTDAKLVLSSHANTIVDIRAGLLHLDALFDFQITQGRIERLTFKLPSTLSITALDGDNIRTWSLTDAVGSSRDLVVELSRSQEKEYRLRIHAEAGMDTLPTEIEVPAIESSGGIRASGHLAVGTDNALQLVVLESTGLTQIDATVFPRMAADTTQDRLVPNTKAFFYTYAGSHYQLRLSVDDIVPSCDVTGRLTVTIKEDDLVIDTELELDVRDAAIRELEIVIPAGMIVASVDGSQVDDYHLSQIQAQDSSTRVRVVFSKPVIGRALLHLRLELGHGPLGQSQTISAVQVTGAKTHRGYVVVAAETGIEIEDPQVENLREVHTASVPLRVSQAQYAYRFRQSDWTLNLTAQSKAAGIRTEVFHLQSVGETLVYGSAVMNYIITGSPVDELRFSLPESVENVEFVGSDVRRWVKQEDVWIVKLTRKVIGDYNLAVTYTQRYGSEQPIHIGALQCRDVQAQTGYVVVTSHLDLKLQIQPAAGVNPDGLLEIALDELPGDYRLLTSSPILAAYKYVTEPHSAMLSIDPYSRSGLLPVMVDIASHQTRLAVHPNGRIESVTRIRYKVKNTTGQFLSLTMPTDTRVWSVSQIETKEGREQQTRLAASYDTNSGQLLIPLSRKANPNDPATIQLEYGQVHEKSGWWRRHLDLTAPLCTVPVNYAEWVINAPDEWTIHAGGGNMQVLSGPMSHVGLAEITQQIFRLWTKSIERWIEKPVIWGLGAVLFVLCIFCAIFFRQWLPDLAVAILLLVLVWAGVGASMAGQVRKPVPVTTIGYAQAVNSDPNQALQVTAELIPAWRRAVTFSGLVMVSIIMIASLAVMFLKRRIWWPCMVAILSAALYMAARIPPAWPSLNTLLTWGIPVAIVVWCAGRVFLHRRHSLSVSVKTVVIPVLLMVILPFFLNGCTNASLGPMSMSEKSMIEKIECNLSADAETMELKYKLRISTIAPSRFPLLDQSAVLVSDPELQRNVSLRVEDDQHTIVVDKAGLYEIEATFLIPLEPTDQNHQHQFRLPLPNALTNRVTLTIPDANVIIDAPGAIYLTQTIQEQKTMIETMFVPGEQAVFTWRPKERQASQEEVRFYAQDLALAHMSSGLVQVYHTIRLQIAQGQIDTLKLRIASGQTVTSVTAQHIGSWRFDPATQELEVRLNQAVTGVYEIMLLAQSASASLPYPVRLKPLIVQDALNQHSVIGLATDMSVYLQLDEHPASMNVQDYIRDSAKLIKNVPGLTSEQITQAFRFDSPDGVVTAQVLAVQSELRSQETARFNVEDDRLVYNSQWDIEIAKAGKFDFVLQIPEGFDIDTLVCEEVSHWDETDEAGQRNVRVHFKRKLTGTIQLKLALSQPISQMPERLTVPRVTLEGGLKHSGYIVIGSEQGVRLSVASRQGVSEVNPAELGQNEQGLLAFRLLRIDWELALQTELVQPRVTVQFLHVAKITDGLVRHDHYLRYRLFHAGIKTIELLLPVEATGVTISGPGIARREQLSQGQWRIDLADKIYDQPYLLRIGYETQYDQTVGDVSLIPIRCRNVDLQQGHMVVFATDRVELSLDSVEASLRPAEARSIPKYFGAGDLSGAVMCFRSTSATQGLTVKARRHGAVEQVGADVRRTDIATVVTPDGQAIHRVTLLLRVGAKRHLQTILPENGTIWSLSVDGQSAQPSIRTNAEGLDVLLIPLPQQTSDDVLVDMVYIDRLPAAQTGGTLEDWAGMHRIAGPRFDLPLKQITWHVYIPEGFNYDQFGGTLTIDKNILVDQQVRRYNMQSYERQMVEVSNANDQFAQQQQRLAQELAQQGRQADARRALSIGYNFSRGNRALNEDIRVDLDNLLKQQAKVGLVNARERLRQETSGVAAAAGMITIDGKSVQFSQQQAERIESSLGQADNENLELITQRILRAQEAAEGSVAQLQITMPFSGKILRFDSPLQVEPEAEMEVIFRASRQRIHKVDSSLWYVLILFGVLLALGGGIGFIHNRWDRLHAFLTPQPRPRQPIEPTEKCESNQDENPDESGGQVSTDELV
ncbi:MAG: hypothetical protein JXA82_04670 [Sedimentisphaerales bacterium]|nr:hypothetical protein [Sedimentisphaerales bacterium]